MINLENILPDSTAELLKGGKAAAIGEIREFGGKKYKKTSNGWRPVPKKESVVKETKEEKQNKPKPGSKATYYDGSEVTIEAVASLSDKDTVIKLLKEYDDSGAMKESLTDPDERRGLKRIKYLVGVIDEHGNKAVSPWDPSGVFNSNFELKQ